MSPILRSRKNLLPKSHEFFYKAHPLSHKQLIPNLVDADPFVEKLNKGQELLPLSPRSSAIISLSQLHTVLFSVVLRCHSSKFLSMCFFRSDVFNDNKTASGIKHTRQTRAVPAGKNLVFPTSRSKAVLPWTLFCHSVIIYGEMRVVVAKPRGFCAGVERAIEIVERALEMYGTPDLCPATP